MKNCLLWPLLLLICGGMAISPLQAQSVDLSVSPSLITLTRGQSAEFACRITANAFAQQAFLAVDSTDFEANFGTYDFQPAFLNAPYDDTAKLLIATLGTMPVGTYTFVLSAGNGGINDTDTVFLQVEADSCSWVVNNPPDLGTDEDLVGLGSDGANLLWITARTRLIGFDSLAWQSHPYPNNAEATAQPVVDHLGRVLVPSTAGLLIWDGSTWSSFNSANSPLPDNFVGSVLQAPNQDLYLGTKGGLAIYDGQFWMVYDSSFTNLPNNDLRDLVYIDGQSIWGITYFGEEPYMMVEFTGSDFETTENRLLNVGFTPCDDTAHLSLAVDAQDNIWIGTLTGLVRTEDGEWEKWRRQVDSINHFVHDSACNLLMSDDASPLISAYITYVYVDGGDLWLMGASRGNGSPAPPAQLVRKQDTVWKSFTTQNSTLPDSLVRSIARVGSRLWFITHQDGINEGGQLSYIRCGSSEVTAIEADDTRTRELVRVFPNPTREQLRVTYQGNGQLRRIKVMDAQGRALMATQPGSQEAWLNLATLPAGLYLLSLETSNGHIVKKIIKQ